MRLKEIRVHKLFGLFDHVIPLNMDDRITIIHGPNGYGKTAILGMVAGIFESRYGVLRRLPFKSLELEFDDGRVLTIKQVESEGRAKRVSLSFSFTEQEPFQLGGINPKLGMQFPLDMIEHAVPDLQQLNEEWWVYTPTGKTLDLDDVLNRFGDEIEDRLGIRVKREPQPAWFVSLQKSLDVHFIRTNRLERAELDNGRSTRAKRQASMQVVARYSRELADLIRETLAQYAEISQSLDRSFPRRLVASEMSRDLSMEKIRDDLALLEQKRKELTEAGLLDKEEQSHFGVAPQIDDTTIDETKIDVLSVYIEDAKRKLSVFDNLFTKIKLFLDLLNRRLQFKTVSIDKNDGIVFRTPDGKLLSAASLSSGEQHEVVLLYQLLFKVKPNSLILIDEPELSLHIAWQKQFLQDLEQITRLADFDVLIATHSPQIIGDRWDLTVELKGPDGCESTSPHKTLLTK